MARSKLLAITAGMGVGPEITARALAAEGPLVNGHWDVVVVGRARSVVPAFASVNVPLERALDWPVGPTESVHLLDPGDHPGELTEAAAIRLATEACLAHQVGAMVTGPIHKKRLVEGGFTHRGHTDYLGTLCGVDEPVMAFVGGDLRVALVTHHQPLMSVAASLTVARIERVVRLATTALLRDLGLSTPRVAVCGLNPHAGEGGLLGQEELDIIGPACERLRASGLRVHGPVSAETAFIQARRNEVDLVVAMYHDQGLAPLKAVDFGRSVNWTIGLPIVRTSVDHGTADALVGTGTASADSMRAALRLARQVVGRRSALGQSQSDTSPSTAS